MRPVHLASVHDVCLLFAVSGVGSDPGILRSAWQLLISQPPSDIGTKVVSEHNYSSVSFDAGIILLMCLVNRD